ncbi:hypothetical protein Salat_1876600 [Sesamum alatum]|uniref:Uncharacterized protein n=1 Tax=Sesamum alatum TaxID=300844 RepID=A0AAE1Y3G4_9LAMI|nr:hypothetical protein Salat_1876600 [Sesamum alatum]
MKSLKTLERFKAHWTERYGFSSVGATSIFVGATMEVTSSLVGTEGCCVSSSTTRVSSLGALLGFLHFLGFPKIYFLSGVTRAPLRHWRRQVGWNRSFFIGIVRLRTSEVPHVDPITDAFVKSIRKSLTYI